MFRGEPIALWTMIFGFLSFIMVQIFGLILTSTLHSEALLPLQAHFFLAYFGWIGLTILGAQLQFFKAITGLRKYTPQSLRYFYHLFLVLGLLLMVYGSYERQSDVVTAGIFIYFLAIVIHTYWIIRQSKSKYFKFPLDYMFVSNLFFIISIILMFLHSIDVNHHFVDISSIRHMLSVGWISLTLQGAIVRILPMFVGKNIDRNSRIYLRYHFIYSSLTSVLFVVSFIMDIEFIILVTGFLWFISWVWTLLILKRSVIRKNLDYKQTLLFFIPGMIWFILGVFLGFYISIQDNLNINTNFRALHIHLSLLLGITMIMLGAFHRITTFQIYTLLYTGKRDTSITLRHLLRLKRLVISAILFNFSIVYMAYGFVDNNFDQVGIGGILILISTGVYSSIIIQNFIHYMMNKDSAIPFWLKSTEVSSD